MHLLIGLGNPELKHRYNRHNIGFLIVDKIAQEFQFPPFKNRFKGLLSENLMNGSNIKLLKPSTYMNNSGESIVQAMRFLNSTLPKFLYFTTISIFHRGNVEFGWVAEREDTMVYEALKNTLALTTGGFVLV